MKRFKKIGQIIVYTLIVLVFVIAVLFVIAMTGKKENGTPQAFGYTFVVVQTNSMSGTIEVNDLIVGKVVDPETTEIKLDDIVTYKAQIQGVATTKTHRVTKIVTDNGSMTEYETWGDNREVCPVPDESYRTINDIVSVYQFTIPVAGSVLTFLKTKIGFFLGVALPLLVFIVWEIVDAVKIVNKVKGEQAVAVAVDGTSEDVKDAIIKEYLAKQAAEKAAAEAAAEAKAEEKPDNEEKKE